MNQDLWKPLTTLFENGGICSNSIEPLEFKSRKLYCIKKQMNQVKKNKEKQIHIIALFTPTNIINYTHWIYLFKFIKNEVMVSLNSINEGGESRTQAQQKSLSFFFLKASHIWTKLVKKGPGKEKAMKVGFHPLKKTFFYSVFKLAETCFSKSFFKLSTCFISCLHV